MGTRVALLDSIRRWVPPSVMLSLLIAACATAQEPPQSIVCQTADELWKLAKCPRCTTKVSADCPECGGCGRVLSDEVLGAFYSLADDTFRQAKTDRQRQGAAARIKRECGWLVQAVTQPEDVKRLNLLATQRMAEGLAAGQVLLFVGRFSRGRDGPCLVIHGMYKIVIPKGSAIRSWTVNDQHAILARVDDTTVRESDIFGPQGYLVITVLAWRPVPLRATFNNTFWSIDDDDEAIRPGEFKLPVQASDDTLEAGRLVDEDPIERSRRMTQRHIGSSWFEPTAVNRRVRVKPIRR